jgi:ribosome-associated protein
LRRGVLSRADNKSRELVKLAARAADDKKAEDVVILDMRKIIPITDYFLICSGETTRQVKTISMAVEEKLGVIGHRPFMREGEIESAWILMDYIDFVVHVFRNKERNYYQLERLWRDAPKVRWQTKSR